MELSVAFLTAETDAGNAQALAIALTVFVVLTALSIAFVVLLFVNKDFRAFFFRDTEKTQPEKTPEPEAPQPEKEKAAVAEQPKSTPKKRAKQDYDADGIPTVPLDTPPAMEYRPAEIKKSKKSSPTPLDNVPTVVLDTPAPDSAKTKPNKKTASKPKQKK